VPGPPDLGDPVTGGIGGQLAEHVLGVEPDLLVFVRSPALLVVHLADLRQALRDERVTWHLAMRLPLRESSAHYRGYVGERLWPPAGFVDRVQRPADEVTLHELSVVVESLVSAPTATTATAEAPRWHEVEPDLPKLPSMRGRFGTLATLAVPSGAAEALALAREMKLEERSGAYGAVKDVHDRLRDLCSQDPEDSDDARLNGGYHGLLEGTLWHQGTVYEATAFAILPLVGILVDEKTLDRPRLAGALGLFAVAAGKADGSSGPDAEVCRGIQLAFRCALPTLLRPPPLDDEAGKAWRRLLLAIGMPRGKPAKWFRKLAKADAGCAELLTRITEDGDELFDLVAENDSL
jgi:hypothetical protein